MVLIISPLHHTMEVYLPRKVSLLKSLSLCVYVGRFLHDN